MTAGFINKQNKGVFRILKIVRLAVIVGVVKSSNKKNLKNAEKVRFYKGLTQFQNLKDCQDQLRKIGQKITKNLQLSRFV